MFSCMVLNILSYSKDKAEIRLSYRPGEGNTAYTLGYGCTYTYQR